jgi:hypothetical protein
MLEATKKHHTHNMQDVHFMGPVEKIRKLIVKAKSLGLVDVSDSIPWRNTLNN